MSISQVAARLQQNVPNAETRIDDALIAVSELMTSIVSARREVDVPGSTSIPIVRRPPEKSRRDFQRSPEKIDREPQK